MQTNLLIDFDGGDGSRESHQHAITIALWECKALDGVVIGACNQALLAVGMRIVSAGNRCFADAEGSRVVIADLSPDSDVSIIGSASDDVPKTIRML